MIADETPSGPAGTGAGEVRVYVNDRGVSVASGSTALDAVSALVPEQAREVAAGTSRLTDSRGLPIDAGVRVHGGLILRVLPVRSQASE